MYLDKKMDLNSKEIQLQYEGFVSTPLLWKRDIFWGLKQFEILNLKSNSFEGNIRKNLPLGKRVEHFVECELKNLNSISVVAKNCQIQNKTLTLGELDFIIKKEKKPIHLEVAYKFYLFEACFGDKEIEHWIGPNRKDNLVKKLTKLKEKQLPILHSIYTKPLLDKLGIQSQNIEQFVHFKAQLFIPLQLKQTSFELINNECIIGFYIRINELNQFSTCKFYIPTKTNWLQAIQIQTKWISFDLFSENISKILDNKTSPLCWLKCPNGTTKKFFIVWW